MMSDRAKIVGELETALAARIDGAIAPVVDAVLSLQNNQAVLVGAVNGFASRVDSLAGVIDRLATRVDALEKTTGRLAEVVVGMQQSQQTLVASLERLHTERLVHVESRLAALEARIVTANDR